MLSKEGMLAEDVRIQARSRSYHNLDHYSPNWVSTGPSIYGAFNSFRFDVFEYDRFGEPVVAKFRELLVSGNGKGTRRIRIPISRMREEISELENALWEAIGDETKVTITGEGRFQFKVNEQAERLRGLIKQRKDFLNMYVDMLRQLEQHYAGIELTK